MRNFICMALFSMVFFSSCLTSLNTRTSVSWIFGHNSLEKSELSKNEIVYRNRPAKLPDEFETNLFGKISWFNSLLGIFDLHETLSFEEKEAFFNALFGFIPATPMDDFFRAAAIGEYFSDKSPLILYARVYKPSAQAPAGSKIILQFTGNFFATRDTQTGEIRFTPFKGMIVPNWNWSDAGAIFTDGSIVTASSIFSQKDEDKIKEEAGGNIYLQYVNLADMYIRDEIKSNDDKILEMLHEAFTDADDVTVRVAAKLNTFLYYLYKQDIASAEEALTTALQLSKEMENIDPSFKRVIDIEAPTMLKLYRNNRVAQ